MKILRKVYFFLCKTALANFFLYSSISYAQGVIYQPHTLSNNSMQNNADEENSSDSSSDRENSNFFCKDLEIIDSFEKLLVILYSNIDTDCFFKTTPAFLESKIGLEVVDYKEGKNKILPANKRKNKLSSPLNDTIYINRYFGKKMIRVSAEYIDMNENQSLLPGEEFPIFLPKPEKKVENVYISYPPFDKDGKNMLEFTRKDFGVYKSGFKYFWKKNGSFLYLDNDFYSAKITGFILLTTFH